MPVSRSRLTAVAVLPLALITGACSQPDQTAPGSAAMMLTPSPTAPLSPQLEGVKVTVVPGKSAKLELPGVPFTAPPGYRQLKPGTGPVVAKDQAVTADLLVVNGKDGKTLETTYGKTPANLSLGEPTLLKEIEAALIGQRVGAQLLVATGAGQDQPQQGISASDTMVFLFEIHGVRTPLKEATGTSVAPKPGLPTVTMGATPRDPATFTLPAGAPPKTTVAQPLIVGQGPAVLAGQRIRVSYTGVTWRDPAKPFDYSGKTPAGYAEFDIGRGQLIKAWDRNLVGQRVGSRLLLVVPPADGYGAAGQGEIKGTDTLVFVLDILDTR